MKIQDGCSFSCAFCVIPLVRGATRSRRPTRCSPRSSGAWRRAIARSSSPASTSAASATARRATRCRGSSARRARSPGVERLRLSSIEVNHLTDELVAALRETPVVSRHLHVPLQSGDDGVLRAMGRRYTAAQYLRAARRRSRDFNLTADVSSASRRGRVRLRAHARRRSRRGDHARSTCSRTRRGPGQRPRRPTRCRPQVKKERSARLRALSDELCRAPLGVAGGLDGARPRRPARPRLRRRLHAVARRRAEVGRSLRARAVGVSEEGILAVAA